MNYKKESKARRGIYYVLGTVITFGIIAGIIGGVFLLFMPLFGKYDPIKGGDTLVVEKNATYKIYYEYYMMGYPGNLNASFEFENTETGEKYQAQQPNHTEKVSVNEVHKVLIGKVKLPAGTYRVNSNSGGSNYVIYKTMSLPFSRNIKDTGGSLAIAKREFIVAP